MKAHQPHQLTAEHAQDASYRRALVKDGEGCVGEAALMVVE